MISTVFVSSLRTDVNVPTVRKIKKKLAKHKLFFDCILKATAKNEKDPDPESDPDPVIQCTYTRIRTRIKMSWIRNTGSLYKQTISRMLSLSIYLYAKKPTFSISSFLVSAMPAGNMAFMYILDWSSPAACSPGLKKTRFFWVFWFFFWFFRFFWVFLLFVH